MKSQYNPDGLDMEKANKWRILNRSMAAIRIRIV